MPRLARPVLLALLSACSPAGDGIELGASDTDTDTDADADTDADSDTDLDDTGVAQLFFVGEFQFSHGAFLEARFGEAWFGLGAEGWICTLTGTLAFQRDATEDCPGCDWAFELAPIADSEAVGDACAALGLHDGDLDGDFGSQWGFAPLAYYTVDDTLVPIYDVVVEGPDWIPFAFRYGDRDWTTVRDEIVSVERPAFASPYDDDYVYYYL